MGGYLVQLKNMKMMKLIDKLFEKLGYTRIKDAHRTIEFYKRKYLHLVDEIFNTENKYYIFSDSEKRCYVVKRCIPGAPLSINIKEFHWDNDIEYAMLCARELVEVLEKEV